MQISAEQLLAEAWAHKNEVMRMPDLKITDPTELEHYKQRM